MDNQIFLENITMDEQKKQQSLERIRAAVAAQKPFYTLSWPKLLADQLRFISYRYWLLQLGFMAFAFGFFYLSGRNGMKGQEQLLIISILISFMGITGITELNRCFACQTAELEQSCYFNLRQIFSIRMILFGGMDLLFIAILIPFGRMEYQLVSFGIYLLVPFVLSNIIYLVMLGKLRGREGSGMYILATVVMGMVSLLLKEYGTIYDAAYTGIWAVILVCLVVILGWEIRHMLCELEKGEKICMN